MLRLVSATRHNWAVRARACGPGPAGQLVPTETFLETAQEVQCVQEVDKVPAAQGSPAPESMEKDTQETSCSQDTASQRDIGDAAFHDA